MKKNLRLVFFAICIAFLVGQIYSWITPAGEFQAAANPLPASSGASLPEKIATLPDRPAPPVIAIVTGLVCTVFAVMAIAPMALGIPADGSGLTGHKRV